MSMISGSLICWRGSFRPMVFKPRAAMLGMLSIALGVAVFLAITIANRSAMGSFRQAFSIITGSADLEIRGSIPEEVLPEVQACEGVAIATPLVEAMVTLPENPRESLHLIGIDPLSAADLFPLRPSFGSAGQGDLSEWLARDDGLAVTEGFLKHHHLRQGDSISLQGPGEPRRLQIRYIARNDAMSSDGSAGVAAMDLGAAQEWVGKTGTLSAILIRLRDPKERKDVVERLRAHLPADVQVEPPSRRTQQVEIMLSAFRLNLSALSLVSLMVGMFFVGNSAAASVVRRRVSLGIMRAMGTGRGTILGLVLVESAFSGVVGSAMGVLLSPLLAAVLARPVAQTVTALYLPVDTNGGWPTPRSPRRHHRWDGCFHVGLLDSCTSGSGCRSVEGSASRIGTRNLPTAFREAGPGGIRVAGGCIGLFAGCSERRNSAVGIRCSVLRHGRVLIVGSAHDGIRSSCPKNAESPAMVPGWRDRANRAGTDHAIPAPDSPDDCGIGGGGGDDRRHQRDDPFFPRERCGMGGEDANSGSIHCACRK